MQLQAAGRRLAAFAAAVAMFSCALPADAASPAPLPNPSQVTALGDLIGADESYIANRLSDGELTADICEVSDGTLTCACVRSGTIRYDNWRPGEFSGLAVSREDLTLVAGAGIAVDAGWALTDVWWEVDGAVLHATEAYLSEEQTRLGGINWYPTGHAGIARVEACGVSATVDANRTARASAAVLTDNRWRLEGYRAGPWPAPWARDASKPAPGLLPPTARFAGDDFSAVAEGSLLGSTTLWAGAAHTDDLEAIGGASVVTRRRGAFRRFDLGLSSAPDPLVEGAFDVGGRAHARGIVEHPIPERLWRLRRLENDAFFRDWRMTRVGGSLSGEAHALQLAGFVMTDPEPSEPQWDGVLTYGLDIDGGRFAKWTIDVDHASETGVDTTHSATASVGWSALLGWAERAWLKPGADLVANYAAVSARRGFDASTTISVLPSAEAGLAFEGRFDRAVHRIVPRVRFGAEVWGEQQRQPEEGSPPYPYTRPDRWRWAVATLDQSIRNGDFRLRLPVGVYGAALGDESFAELTSPTPFARLVASLPRISAQAAVACTPSCAAPAYRLGGVVSSRHLSAWYSGSNLSGRTAAVVLADSLTERGHTAVRLVNDDTADRGFGHHAGVEVRAGSSAAWVAGRLPDDPDNWGLDGGASWIWDATGWGVSTSVGWRPETGDFSVLAGLALER